MQIGAFFIFSSLILTITISILIRTVFNKVVPNLITNNAEAEINDAKEILKVKWKAPLAMQTKDSASFNEILAKKFTFRAEDQFFSKRNDFIKNRITGK